MIVETRGILYHGMTVPHDGLADDFISRLVMVPVRRETNYTVNLHTSGSQYCVSHGCILFLDPWVSRIVLLINMRFNDLLPH